MQFSVAARESCTLHCVLLDCIGTKCTGNALNIPAAACSLQLLRETNFPQVAISFLLCSFHPMRECICDRFDCRQCCHSLAGIFKWNFDDFISEILDPHVNYCVHFLDGNCIDFTDNYK